MSYRLSTLAGVALLAMLAVVPSQAQTILTGQNPGGAYYAIAVPDAWNGTLVVWNHGYDFSPVSPDPDLGPLAEVQLSQGYALAASSYRQSQWAVFKSSKDVNLLVRTFKRLVGEPDAIILTGASLGGIVTADALERANLKNVVGAYPFCGALAGSRTWDGGFDLRLTYNAICDDVPGGAIPGGPTGLPPGIPFISGEQIAVAVNACTGLLTPPEFQTPEQQANLAQLLGSTQLPPQFIITDLFFGTNGLSNLTFDPGKLNGGQGIGNSDVTYADPDIDARIERVLTQRKAARKLQRNFTPSGELQNEDVKIVSMHTDKDGLVIVEHEREYQDVIDPDQLTVAIVVEEQPSHCGFSPAELTAGWESLRGWLAGAPQPSAASIQGTCQAIEGFVGGPCRIDPSFEVPDMDGRIPPRDNIRNSVKPE